MSSEKTDVKGNFFRSRWLDHAAGLLFAAVYVSILISTADDVGFSRDEGFYFKAAEDYLQWFELLARDADSALTDSAVKRYWRYNTEHPALMKELFGFSYKLFHKELGWTSPSLGHRIPGMLMSGLGLYILFLFTCELWGRRAGLAAMLFYALMPRYFYHSHLNCFDVAIATMIMATVYAYWKSLRSWGWGIATGAIWGIALCTKHNAMFLPPILIFHYFVWLFWTRKSDIEAGRRVIRFPTAFLSMLVLGPAIFYAHWPWIWWDTIKRVSWYIGFHRDHPFYNIAYFGYTVFRAPTPVSYPTVMTFITIPGISLLLMLAGSYVRLRTSLPGFIGRRLGIKNFNRTPSAYSSDLLTGMSVLWPVALISLPFVPIFGGTKHWSPSWPFIAMFAGYGFKIMSAAVGEIIEKHLPGRRRLARAAPAVLLTVVMAAPLYETVSAHPYGLEYYTPLIGGTPGAADAGMCRQFWGYTTRDLLPWLNENMPKGARVFFHDTAYPSMRMYQRDGNLRNDIQWSGIPGSNAAMIHHEHHMAREEYDIWTAYGTANPSTVLTYAGVPIITLYEPSGGYRSYWKRRALAVRKEEKARSGMTE